MAVLSFKNEQGRWELVEVPGMLKFYPQELTEEQKAQARTNMGIDKLGIDEEAVTEIAENVVSEKLINYIPMPINLDEALEAYSVVLPAIGKDPDTGADLCGPIPLDVTGGSPAAIPMRDSDGNIILNSQSNEYFTNPDLGVYAVNGNAVKAYVEAQITALETRLKAYINETILNGEW